MIFAPALARKILAAQKTQARIPRKPSEWHCRYRPGETYAIQPGAGQAQIGRLMVLSIGVAELMDMGYHDARREGFRTQREFFDHWLEQYGRIIPDLPVWVVSFEVAEGRDVFLAPIGARSDEHAHTTERDALDAGAVPDAIAMSQITTASRARWNEDRAVDIARKDAKALRARLALVQREAILHSVDVSDEERAIRRALAKAQAKLRDRPAG